MLLEKINIYYPKNVEVIKSVHIIHNSSQGVPETVQMQTIMSGLSPVSFFQIHFTLVFFILSLHPQM
jgi:hypothetical protein